MSGMRRKSRSLALQALYEADCAGHNAEKSVDRLLNNAEDLSEDNTAFARQIVVGVTQNRNNIDLYIQQFAPAWPLKQIPLVDRNILRIAIYEILFNEETPIKVSVNEAVELAKRYGSESSPRFINGVLGSVSTISGRQS